MRNWVRTRLPSQEWKRKGCAIALREPQRGTLIPPVEGQTGVGHQLVGGEAGRLPSRQDRGDNVRGEKSQSDKARCIGRRDLLLMRDVLDRPETQPARAPRARSRYWSGFCPKR